jgi:uncharacterized protein GlcG (DUF336 family)
MASLTQHEAEGLIKKAQRKAEQLHIKVSVYVVDASGTPVAFSRMDGATMLTPDIARAKAFSLMKAGGERVNILPGGVLVMKGREIIGAIGVSGGAGHQDHECGVDAAT